MFDFQKLLVDQILELNKRAIEQRKAISTLAKLLADHFRGTLSDDHSFVRQLRRIELHEDDDDDAVFFDV